MQSAIVILMDGIATSSLAIESGPTLEGTIDIPGQSNTYHFAASAGDAVQIRMAETNATALVMLTS